MAWRSSFATDLPEVAADFLSRAYQQVQFEPADGDRGFRLAHDRVDAGPFKVDDIEIFATVDTLYAAEEEYFVARVNRGRRRHRAAGVEDSLGPGELSLIGRPGVESTSRVEDIRQDVVTLRAAAVREAAGLDPEGEELPTFTSIRSVSPERARALGGAVDFVIGTLLADPEVGGAPLVIGSAERLLADLALAAFPNTATAEPLRRDGHDGHDARAMGAVRRAVSFIESNADLDIGIGDIAAAAQVSRRTVQLAFRRHMNTTPTAYLRRVRLDLADRELSTATNGDGLTVTEVAYRWGFSSPSRFAERYRAAFGNSPSETLHR